MSVEISIMAESQAFVLVVHIIIGNGGSLYSRIHREQFRQRMKEKFMEVSIFLRCVKKCSA
jgi:hypothetical protein